MAIVTDYKLGPEVKAWLDSEVEDYLNPQHWVVSKDEDGKTIWKKDLDAAGVKERKNIAWWKFAAVIPGAKVDEVYNIIHKNGIKYQTELSEGFDGGLLVEVLTPDRIDGMCEEAVVQHRAFRLKVVNNRDFFTLTCQRTFTGPNGKPVIASMTRSTSTLKPDYPKPLPVAKGFTRGEVLTCCAFLYQTEEGVHYTYTQRCDIHLALPVPKAIIH
eukprot:EG_transcript_22076